MMLFFDVKNSDKRVYHISLTFQRLALLKNLCHSLIRHIEACSGKVLHYNPKVATNHICSHPPMKLATNQRFTLVMESLHSIKLAYNTLNQYTPHVYIDITGCAFTFIVAKLLANCKVIAYVHYPTISTVSFSRLRCIATIF